MEGEAHEINFKSSPCSAAPRHVFIGRGEKMLLQIASKSSRLLPPLSLFCVSWSDVLLFKKRFTFCIHFRFLSPVERQATTPAHMHRAIVCKATGAMMAVGLKASSPQPGLDEYMRNNAVRCE
jgi:hypothetical protein